MAKRRQTTGLPKKDRQKHSAEEAEQVSSGSLMDRLLGHPKTPKQYEEALNRLIMRTVAVVGIIIAVIIGIALVWEFVVVPNSTVATVNGQGITVREFRERMRFEQALVFQQANARYQQLQQQAQAFGMDVNQLLQNDQQFQQWNQELQFPDILGQRVLQDMIEDELVRQEVEQRNLTISDDLVQGEINDYFGYDPTEVALVGTPATETPTPTITPTPYVSPTPTMTPTPEVTPEVTAEATAEVTAEATAEATEDPNAVPTIPPSPTPSQEDLREDFEETVDLFRGSLQDNNVSSASFDNFFLRRAQREALLMDVVGEDTSFTYVNARHILVETEEQAQAIIEALENGESFSELARALSTDTNSGAQGGELGWAPAARYVSAFRDALLEAEIGEIVGPVESEFGFHVIQVRAREEREAEGTELEGIRQSLFQEWLQDLREENDPNISINNNWPDYLPN